MGTAEQIKEVVRQQYGTTARPMRTAAVVPDWMVPDWMVPDWMVPDWMVPDQPPPLVATHPGRGLIAAINYSSNLLSI